MEAEPTFDKEHPPLLMKRASALVTFRPKYKFWLETEDGYVFGEGSFELLQGIQEKGTLTASSQELHMSYRHAWGIIKQLEDNLGQAVLVTHKGGKAGGGGAELTPMGQTLLHLYVSFTEAIDQILADVDLPGNAPLPRPPEPPPSAP